VFFLTIFLLLSTIGVVGLKKKPMKIPVVSACSLAMSAACHPPADEIEPHLENV
jgi:hypothetical protein